MRSFQVFGGCLAAQYLVRGPIDNNVYLIDDGDDSVIVVDPCRSAQDIVDYLQGTDVSAIFITHNHFDHIGALFDLHDLTGAPVYASGIDSHAIESGQHGGEFHVTVKACPVDHKLEGGEIIAVGKTLWQILLTPGHTKGGLCYYCEKGMRDGAPMLISGDTLFYGGIGRTDFEGGSMSDMRKSLAILEGLPDETIVLPGHNRLTSIAEERVRTLEAL